MADQKNCEATCRKAPIIIATILGIATIALGIAAMIENDQVGKFIYCPYQLSDIRIFYSVGAKRVNIEGWTTSHWKVNDTEYQGKRIFLNDMISRSFFDYDYTLREIYPIVMKMKQREVNVINAHYNETNGTCNTDQAKLDAWPPEYYRYGWEFGCVLNRDEPNSCLDVEYYNFHTRTAHDLKVAAIVITAVFVAYALCLTLYGLQCYSCCSRRRDPLSRLYE